MRQTEEFQEPIHQMDRYRTSGMVVYLFGSSVRDDHTGVSDIDIAIDSADRDRLALIRADLEESTIPYKVDVVDMSSVSDELRDTILKEGIVIWK